MNDAINLDFVFQFAGDIPPIHVNPASNVVQTGDALQIALLIILALVAVFSGVFLYLKKPATVVGKHCALTKSKIAPRGGQNAVLKFVLIASAVLLCVFSVIFATTNAFAKNESNLVVQTPEQVFVSVDRDSGFVSIDDSWMKNVGSKDLLFETSTLSINSEVIDVATLTSVNMKISALGGILYSGNPDGQPYVIDNLTHVFTANTQETLSFVLSNLDGETAKQLAGKKVFSLNLTYKEAVNPIHNVVVPEVIETTYDKNPHGAAVSYEVDGDLPTDLFYRKQGTETWIEGSPQVVNVVDSGTYEYKITATDKFLVYETIGEYNPITINKATRSIIEWSIENQPTFPDSLYTTFKLSDDEYDDTIITVRPASSGEYFPFTYNVDKSKKEITFIPSDGTGKFGVDATLNIISSNYNDASYNQTLVVGSRQLSFNVNNVSAVYDNKEHCVSFTSDSSTPNNISVDYSLSGESTSYHKEWTDVSQALQLDDIKQKDAITDEINIKFTASVKGYTDLKGVASIKISPIPVTLNWGETVSWKYDGNSHHAEAEIQLPSNAYVNDLALTYEIVDPTFFDPIDNAINVGSYISIVKGITEGGQATNNYSLPNDIYARIKAFSIAPRVVEITWTPSEAGDWVYAGQNKKYSYTATVNNKAKNTDEVLINCTLTKDGEFIDYSEICDAAAYKWTASSLSGTASSNYTLEGASETTKTQSIACKFLDDFSWDTLEYTYDGNDQHPVATIRSGIISPDIVNVTNYEIKIKDGATVSSSIDADEYQIKPIALDNSNYKISSSVTYQNYKINQATGEFVIVNVTKGSTIYVNSNEQLQLVVAFATDGQLITTTEDGTIAQASLNPVTKVLTLSAYAKFDKTKLSIKNQGNKNYTDISNDYYIEVKPSVGVHNIEGKVSYSKEFDAGHTETPHEGLVVNYDYQVSGEQNRISTVTDADGNFKINVDNIPVGTTGKLNIKYNGYYGEFEVTTTGDSLYDKNIVAFGPNFETYSWPEVKNMGSDISANKESSIYYNEAVYYAENGITKTLFLGDDHSETASGSDRLFMRIIGVNHDDKADGSGTAGLTLMAANAIDEDYYYEDNSISNTKNWSSSKLRNNMNLGEIYDSLIGALGGVTPVKVNKSYAKGYEDGTGTYDSTISSIQDTFFLPSLYEIGGDDYLECGKEGKQYQYIKNDRWLATNTPGCIWHDSAYPGSVLNSINWKGYLWFLERGPLGRGGSKWVFNHRASDAFGACKDVGGCVACINPDSSWERSVFPYLSINAMCLDYTSTPNYNCLVYQTCSVAPCFCL